MKKVGFWFALLTTVVVPLVRTILARRRRRSRLQTLMSSAADAGESALDSLSDLAGSAIEHLGQTGRGPHRRAKSTAGLADSTAALLAGTPRLVAQLRGDEGYPYRGREDWRKYGEVYSR
jgi:hypothetical protein